MNFTTIEIKGQPFALVPLKEMQRLTQAVEANADIRAYDEAKAAFKASGAEALPLALTKRILKGAHPVRVYREYRDMTQAELAKKAGISASYITMLEAGKRKGNVATLKALAKALRVTLEELA